MDDLVLKITAEDKFSATITKLQTELFGASKSLKKAGAESDTFSKSLEVLGEKVPGVSGALGSFKNALVLLTNPVVAGVAVLAGLAVGLGKISSAAEESNHQLVLNASKAQVSIQEFASLEKIAKKCGVETDFMVSAMGRLEKNLGTNSEALKKFGVTSHSPIEALGQVAEAMKNTIDPTERARLGNLAFGKSWQQLIPILKDGKKAVDSAAASVYVSERASANWEKVHKVHAAQEASKKEVMALISDLWSYVDEFVYSHAGTENNNKKLLAGARWLRKEINGKTEDATIKYTSVIPVVPPKKKGVPPKKRETEKSEVSIIDNSAKIAAENRILLIRNAREKELAELKKEYAEKENEENISKSTKLKLHEQYIIKARLLNEKFRNENKEKEKENAEKIADIEENTKLLGISDSFQKEMEQLNYKYSNEIKKAENNVALKTALEKEFIAEKENLAREYQTKEAAQTKESSDELANLELNIRLSKIKDLYERELESLRLHHNLEMTENSDNRAKQILLEEQYQIQKAEIVNKHEAEIQAKEKETVEKYSSILSAPLAEFEHNLVHQNKTIGQNFSDLFSSIAENFEIMLERMIAEWAAKAVIMTVLNGVTEGQGGWVASIVGAFAGGTDYAPGGWSLVGERGPELVNLPRGSQVKTANETKNFLGGNSYTVNISNTGISARDIVSEFGIMEKRNSRMVRA